VTDYGLTTTVSGEKNSDSSLFENESGSIYYLSQGGYVFIGISLFVS